MYGTQTIVSNLTPEQIGELLRGIVRSELSNYAPVAPVAKSITLPEYPSRRQTKEFLGVSYTTLNNWAKDSDGQPAILVPFKVGSRVRYRRDDVLSALKESRRFKSVPTK